jgi:hypothetical protein
MKFRPQRGSLADAMQEVQEMPATKLALAAHLRCDIGDIEVKPYTYDARIGWDTHIVLVLGFPAGFTDAGIQ